MSSDVEILIGMDDARRNGPYVDSTIDSAR